MRFDRAQLGAAREVPFLRGLLGLDVSGNPTPDPHAIALGGEPDVIWQLGPLHQEFLTRHGPLPWLVRRDAGGLPSLGYLELSRPKASPASASK